MRTVRAFFDDVISKNPQLVSKLGTRAMIFTLNTAKHLCLDTRNGQEEVSNKLVWAKRFNVCLWIIHVLSDQSIILSFTSELLALNKVLKLSYAQ